MKYKKYSYRGKKCKRNAIFSIDIKKYFWLYCCRAINLKNKFIAK